MKLKILFAQVDFFTPKVFRKVGPFFFNLILILVFCSPVWAQEPYTLEKIIVRPKRNNLASDSLENNYSVQTLTVSEIKEKNLNSLVDILDYFGGMDLRYRGTQGIQGDLSLRGSTYEQVAILIDGINLMDPQTGHHNLDIPLTEFDVERVQVIKEGASSLYGRGAFAGGVNIITKKPTQKSLNLDTLFGEHALYGQTMSFSLPGKNLSTRMSFDHKISKSARANTDFEYKTASIYLNYDADRTSFDTLFGYQKKDFGADSFYSNLFPEEEEHTETYFVRMGLEPKLNFGSLKNNLFFRKHRDKFILSRNNPTSVNYHTTYVYGLDCQLISPLRYGDFLLGLDLGRDEINSTNLGKYSRHNEAASFGFIPKLPDKLNADLRFRLDHQQKWGEQVSYNFGLGYQLIDEKLKISGSASYAFRIPSFTELYYSDAANKGNAELKEEKSDNFRLGLDFKDRIICLKIEGFLRRGHNLIDWTRTAQTEPWVATNLGRVDFRGIEFSSQLKSDLNFKSIKLEKLVFSYNYISADKKATGFFSKYALDMLKHQFILDIYSALFGLDFSWQLSYNRRYYGETYFMGNLYIGKKIKNKNFILEPFIKIDNFSNAKYTEIAGVLQPRRWIKSGLKFEW